MPPADIESLLASGKELQPCTDTPCFAPFQAKYFVFCLIFTNVTTRENEKGLQLKGITRQGCRASASASLPVGRLRGRLPSPPCAWSLPPTSVKPSLGCAGLLR